MGASTDGIASFWNLPDGTPMGVTSADIDPQADPVDNLVIVARGDTFALYIEGNRVETFVDDTYPVGQMALLALTDQPRSGLNCTFNNVWVFDLSAASETAEATEAVETAEATEAVAEPTEVIATAEATETAATVEPTEVAETAVEVAAVLDAAVLDTLTSLGVSAEGGTLDVLGDVDVPTPDERPGSAEIARNVGDFVVHTTFDWRSASGVQTCGVLFRLQNDGGGYALLFDSSGDVDFLKSDATGLVGDARVPIPGVVNRAGDPVDTLDIVGVGGEFRLYRDRQLIAVYEDDSHASGDMAFYGFTSAPVETAACTFSDVWLWEMGEAETVLPPAPVVPLALTNSLEAANISQPPAETLNDVTLLSADDAFYRPFTNDPTDFAAALQFEWGAGADITCGLLFRLDGANMYFVGLDQQRGVRVTRGDRGAFTLVGEGDADLVFVGEGGTNTLLLVARGETFDVYVNGALVDTFRDDQLAEGRVALMAGVAEQRAGAETLCTVRQAWLWDLNE
jgi:hypothetical protein